MSKKPNHRRLARKESWSPKNKRVKRTDVPATDFDPMPIYFSAKELEPLNRNELRDLAKTINDRLVAIGREDFVVRGSSNDELRTEILTAQRILRRKKA